jgi:hypothetical protein
MTDSLKSATLWGGVGGGETRQIALISSPPVKGYVWSTPRSNSSYPRITEPSLPRPLCYIDSSSCFPCWRWRWPAVRKPSHQHQRVFPTSLRAGRRRRPRAKVQRTTALPTQCLYPPSRTGPRGEPADRQTPCSRNESGPRLKRSTLPRQGRPTRAGSRGSSLVRRNTFCHPPIRVIAPPCDSIACRRNQPQS